MLLRKTYRMPIWMLSAAAAGFLAVPDAGWSQNPSQPQFRPAVQRPASPRQPSGTPATLAVDAAAKPVIQQTQATAPGAETDVQRELRRLYEESGREMPETPTSIQTQRPLPAGGRTAAAPQNTAQPYPTTPNGQTAQAPTITKPVPQPQKSGNPVTSFFKKLVPGNSSSKTAQSRPASPQPMPPAAPPAVAQQPAQAAPKNYTPYNPQQQQPRRLPSGTTAPAQPQQTAAAQPLPVLPLPPSPSQPQAAAPKTAVVVAAPVKPSVPVSTPVEQAAPVAPPQVVASEPSPFFTEPEPVASDDEGLTFEPPIVVTAPAADTAPTQTDIATLLESPLEATATAPAMMEPAEAGDTDLAAAPAEFPDPFPEMSEGEADDLNESEFESPFVGVKLDEEPFPAAETAAQPAPPVAVEEDPLADPLPAAVPTVAPALVVDAAVQPAPTATTAPEVTIPSPSPALTIPAEQTAVPKAEVIRTEAPSVPAAQIVDTSTADQYAERMKQIRERGGMKGLKGFCPVSLRDERELKDSLPEFYSSFRGQKFHFATAEAKAKFDQNPNHYAPAAYGADVVVLVRDKDVAEGSLDFAAWYKGNLYLFGTEETYNASIADPLKYSTPAGLE